MGRIAFLHAHYSNIEEVEAYKNESHAFVHYVNPGLLNSSVYSKGRRYIQDKLESQLSEIAEHGNDLIIVTCTNYIEYLKDRYSFPTPVAAIDDIFVREILKQPHTTDILITNPRMLDGMNQRLQVTALKHNYTANYNIILIEDCFDDLLKGDKRQYNKKIVAFIEEYFLNKKNAVVVGQISMIQAAREFNNRNLIDIAHPLSYFNATIHSNLCDAR